MNSKTVLIRLLPFVYFLSVSLPHHPFSRFLDADFIIPLGYETIQHYADIASVVALAGILVLAIWMFRVQRARGVYHLAFWLLLIALMYASDKYLIVNNIERVHFPQYAMFALLLGLSIRDEVLVFFTSCFGGFVDEFLQFAMNPNKTNYLDFNDIVLNTLGAALGVAILIALRRPAEGEKTKYEQKFRFFFASILVSLGILLLLAFTFNRVVMLVEQAKDRSVVASVNGKLSFIMSFERHDEFWQKLDYEKVFHVLSPLEGVLSIAVLSALVWGTIKKVIHPERRRHGQP